MPKYTAIKTTVGDIYDVALQAQRDRSANDPHAFSFETPITLEFIEPQPGDTGSMEPFIAVVRFGETIACFRRSKEDASA